MVESLEHTPASVRIRSYDRFSKVLLIPFDSLFTITDLSHNNLLSIMSLSIISSGSLQVYMMVNIIYLLCPDDVSY